MSVPSGDTAAFKTAELMCLLVSIEVIYDSCGTLNSIVQIRQAREISAVTVIAIRDPKLALNLVDTIPLRDAYPLL